MNTAHLKAVKLRIDADEIATSIFMDRHGYWAKDWCMVVQIYIRFDDNSTVYLTPAEYKSLSLEQQFLIKTADSEPRPITADTPVTVDRIDITVDNTNITVDAS